MFYTVLENIENLLWDGTLRDLPTKVWHERVLLLSQDQKESLIHRCDLLLEDRDFGSEEAKRIGVVKLLVALLPGSFTCVEKWMFRTGDIYYYEVQFSFCCFLSDVLSCTPIDPAVSRTVLDLVAEYLQRVASDEAYNAMMAADMLGDHWIGDAGVVALLNIARHSPNPVGREAAQGALVTAARHGKLPRQHRRWVNRLMPVQSSFLARIEKTD